MLSPDIEEDDGDQGNSEKMVVDVYLKRELETGFWIGLGIIFSFIAFAAFILISATVLGVSLAEFSFL